MLGVGEWRAPQLRSLLRATVSGNVAIDAEPVSKRVRQVIDVKRFRRHGRFEFRLDRRQDRLNPRIAKPQPRPEIDAGEVLPEILGGTCEKRRVEG